MKVVLVVLSVLFAHLVAHSQTANTKWVLSVDSNTPGYGTRKEAAMVACLTPIGEPYSVVDSKCLAPVYTTAVVDELSNKVKGLDATIDKKFEELTPKLVDQLNVAVAKGRLTTGQVQALKSELHKDIMADISSQLKEMKQQIEALKAALEANKGH